jgi:hypothetical protein
MKELICCNCSESYEVSSERWKGALYDLKKRKINHYCSKECVMIGKNIFKPIEVECKNCQKKFTKLMSQIKKCPNNFCSSSCSATYNNSNKTHGTRKSKLESWLEKQLPLEFPSLEFHFNKKNAINSELDIYIPELKLAFELNGIFHYEPIFGPDKLEKIQNNDQRKFAACLERGIEFCIIDSSGQKYFKPATSQKYLDIIKEVINKKQK